MCTTAPRQPSDREFTACSTCDLSPSQEQAIRQCDFAYFAAVMVPFADGREFRTVCDWGNWIFPYHDLFDNGALRNDPEGASMVMEWLLSGLDERCRSELEDHPEMRPFTKIVRFHDEIWRSVRSTASCGK